MRNFKPLAIFCGCKARFVWDLVGNPEDRFSHNEAHFSSGTVMLLHHMLSIAGLTTCVALNWWGTEMVTTIFGAEFTNPLLQLRWFLRETGNYHTFLGDCVDFAFMFLFGFFRIFLGTMLLYNYFQLSTTDWWGRLGGTAIYSIGWVFWLSIIQYSYKKYKKRYMRKVQKTNGDVKIQELNGNVVEKALDDTESSVAPINGVIHRKNVSGTSEKCNGDI